MAFLMTNNSLFSRLRSNRYQQRGFHVELGAREKALLEEDPALKRFKSFKKAVWRLKRVGDVLTIIVVGGCCYEIYVRTTMKKEAVEAAKASADQA